MKTIAKSTTITVVVMAVFTLLLFSCKKEDPTPTCTDGIKNGIEEGVDCGGQCPPCFSCVDGILNGNETGVDCGGDCIACPTCVDGIQNGNETAVDCGGDCPACPGCDDGIQNGNETGVDCGGTICPPCPILGCTNPDAHNYDPAADTDDGSCETCIDGVQNGDETDVDCGGGLCDACIILGCTDSNAHNYNPEANQDDGSCETCNDGIFNGDEQGVDCGGVLCQSCPTIGDIGPGGGFIFHDKGSFSNGWRYLEAGPHFQIFGEVPWGCIIDLPTAGSLGGGKTNTQTIIDAFNTNQCTQTPTAALFCHELVHGGLDDWYLPSTLELQAIFPYRTQAAIPVHRYWSSFDQNATAAFVVDYGGQSNGIPFTYSSGKHEGSRVLAIRQF